MNNGSSQFLSIDEVLKLDISSSERISTYFPLGARFNVGCFAVIQLLTYGNGRKLVDFVEDMKMWVEEISPGGPRWLVFEDIDGNRFGLAVEAMLGLHSHGQIDIERIS